MFVIQTILSDNRFILTISIIGITTLYLIRKWISGGVCKQTADLHGKIVLITGANTGIGKETARALALLGATLVLACRDEKKSQKAIQELKVYTKNPNIEYMALDLSDLESVRTFAQNFKRKYSNLHILINNAGIMALPNRKTTKQGVEMQFGVNHLGHFLLTALLIDVMKKSSPGRIINLSSMAHKVGHINFDNLNSEKSYGSVSAYGQSKLSIVLFARELNKKLEHHQIKVVSIHPGVVNTELARYILEIWYFKLIRYLIYPLYIFFHKTAWQGAQTSIYCAVCSHEELLRGGYYADCVIASTTNEAKNDDISRRLWERSEELIGQKF